MGQRFVQVDAFTDRPFAGNPAAICVLPAPRDDAWMQNVAREMNLSETAFLVPEGDSFRLRWFTPAVEVDLCGHATLASAHALWEEGFLGQDAPARFQTRSGLLMAHRDGTWIELDFPALPVRERISEVESLAATLGGPVRFAGRSTYDLLVEVGSEESVRALRPDMGRLAALPVRGVIVTSRATSPGFDFVSRFFAPAVGVDEDPVCGSAHCCLAPFWAERLGKSELLGYQASPRGGVVRVRLRGPRVLLGGQAVTVLKGELVE
ncbi:MAG: PhzF family phenazine biosynthesis protein [Isosphaeraceae bacterium]|nr:PhzF family phenazine biosynthesis protein [Isosphaeraceae bacterium]